MKKLLLALALFSGMQLAFADDDAVNIKINIRGETAGNKYFLCIPNVGCLSILAAQRGKVYPIMHDIEMGTLFVANSKANLRLSRQGSPTSCQLTAKTSQTLTISGTLSPNNNGTVMVNGLHCSVS